jgi:hypothetical protein
MDGAKAPERTERPPTPISCLLHRQPGGRGSEPLGFSPLPVPEASLHHKRSLNWAFPPQKRDPSGTSRGTSGRTDGRTEAELDPIKVSLPNLAASIHASYRATLSQSTARSYSI